MKRHSMYLSALACATFLLLMVVGTALLAENPPPPGDTPPQVFQQHAPTQLAPTNDSCRDAIEIAATQETEDSYVGSVTGKKFQNGNNVDDWYSYTTHDTCPNGTISLVVKLTSDYPQTEVEIYDRCYRWPIAKSIYEEPFFDNPGGYKFSGLTKDLAVDCEPNHTYYIHVNYLRPPEQGGAITYDLTIGEGCVEPPA